MINPHRHVELNIRHAIGATEKQIVILRNEDDATGAMARKRRFEHMLDRC